MNILAASGDGIKSVLSTVSSVTFAAMVLYVALSPPPQQQERANDAVDSSFNEMSDSISIFDNKNSLIEKEDAIKIGLMADEEYQALIKDIRLMESSTDMNLDYGDGEADAYYGKRHKRVRPSLDFDSDTGSVGIIARPWNTSSKKANKYEDVGMQTYEYSRPYRALGESVYEHFEKPEIEGAYKDKYGRDIGSEMRLDDVVKLMKEVAKEALSAQGDSSEYENYSDLSNNEFIDQMNNADGRLGQVISDYVINNTDKVLARNNEMQTDIIQYKFKVLGDQVEEVRGRFVSAVKEVKLSTMIDGKYFSTNDLDVAIKKKMEDYKERGFSNMKYDESKLKEYMKDGGVGNGDSKTKNLYDQ